MKLADPDCHAFARRQASLLAVIFLFASGFLAFAAAETNSTLQYSSRAWQLEEGLPQNGVRAISQTREGYLWVGTAKGLARFDGARFKVFDAENTPELKSSSITALCAGRDGSLWIGTDGGVTQYKEGKFSFIPMSDHPLDNFIIITIFQSQDDSLWVGTRGGMFHQQHGAWTHYTEKEGLLSNTVRSFCELPDQLWICTASGLNTWKNGVISNRSELGNGSFRTALRDHKGNIWLAGSSGLMCLRGGLLATYSMRDGLAGNAVNTIHEDRRGDLWVGTSSGMNRMVDGKLRIEKDGQGGFYDEIDTIFEDLEGDIWLGGRDGLQELRVKRFTSYTRRQGLPHNNVMSVMEDRKGNMWLGTYGGGLVRLQGEKANSYGWENNQTNRLTADLILALYEDHDGSILIGTEYQGGTFSLRDGHFSRIWSQEQSLMNPVVRVIYRDREENLWFGARSGLVRGTNSERWLEKSIVRCLLEDRAGTLWVGCNEGLFCRQDGKFINWTAREGRLQDRVVSLYEDQQQNLWIGTGTSGLNRIKNGQLTSYTTKDGLLSDEIFEILEDNHGWLWMSCSKGIFRVSKKNLDDFDQKKTQKLLSIVYGKADGMESVQCNGVAKPGAWKSHDGRLWFATTKGVIVTDPNLSLISNKKPPTVLIEEVVSDKQSFPFQQDNELHFGLHSPKVRVPPGHGDLEFHFTALSFPAPEKNRFKYKLEGVDSEWLEVTRRVAYYNHLRPGTYLFRVIACNNDGVWNTAGANLALIMLPEFWQTWWFRGSMALLMVVVAGGSLRYVTWRNMRHQLQRLEKQHAVEQERIRIARDMHDDIGAKLTKISFLGAVAKRKLALPEEAGAQIDNMSQTARDVIRALDEIIWAVNPANDSLEDLATYLCRNATEFFDNSPISCHFNIPTVLPPYRLGTHVRHNVLLAAKEALNNVLKHSGATSVHVQISVTVSRFEVVILDNGCGFIRAGTPPAASHVKTVIPSSRLGNGLTNMEHRLTSIGGRCRVESRAGQGTRITFTVVLKGKLDE